jgi:hypothetical protein
MLSKDFPMLSFTGIEETWWFSPKRAPNDPLKGIFQSRESMGKCKGLLLLLASKD